jgi:hypothetical protein
MRLRKQPPPPPPPAPARNKPPWQDLIDPLERPSREDLAKDHNVFADSVLEAVPLPRWLRGKRRPPRDKLS